MNFLSPAFLLFLTAVLLLLRIVPIEKRWLLLLPASWFFYACHNVWLLGLLIFATVLSYGLARVIERQTLRNKKKRLLICGCVLLLGMLFVFKYLEPTVGGILYLFRRFGRELPFDGLRLILPMGISFYTFQTLSYLVDVYCGTCPAERHFGIYALYVSFFPQLVAGPIERPGDLIPQLRTAYTPDDGMRSEGLRLLLRGFAKKVIVADCVSGYVDAAYGNPSTAGGAAMLLATILFALQIYCDFSGYSDIALGCARWMGIRLMKNFDRPYRAVTIRDFWRRWHISLTKWFTEYVYIPLGGNRKGVPRQCINILTVFLLSGLWHGADLTFVVWGGLHGVLLIAETLFDRGRTIRHPHLRHLLTLTLVCLSWVFFRADSLSNALLILRTIVTDFNLSHVLTGLGMNVDDLLRVILSVGIIPLLERLPMLKKPDSRLTLVYFLLIIVMVLCRIAITAKGGTPAFIYFQF